jgi:hypothetical protein
MTQPRPIEAWPLAARLSGVGTGYAVIVSPLNCDVPAASAAFYDELESLHDGKIHRLEAATPTQWLEAAAKAQGSAILLLELVSTWGDEDWRALNMQCGRLSGPCLTILVVDRVTAQRMPNTAPHLWSCIGGAVWTLDLRGPEEGS